MSSSGVPPSVTRDDKKVLGPDYQIDKKWNFGHILSRSKDKPITG
jgi:hypothetical protein